METRTDQSDFPEATPCRFCGQNHPRDIRFCPVTGQALLPTKLTCPNCGQDVENDWFRCPHCATMLKDQPEQVARRQGIWKRQGWIILPIIILGLAIAGFILGLFLITGEGSSEKMEASKQESQTEQVSAIGVNTALTVSKMVTSTWTPKSTQMESTFIKTATITPSPRAVLTLSATQNTGPWDPCPGSYLSRLRVNDQAYVALDPPLANRVRSSPGRSNTIIGRIQPGEEMRIMDGPICKDGWIWWKVQAKKTDLVGWTSEGDAESYWLVPLP